MKGIKLENPVQKVYQYTVFWKEIYNLRMSSWFSKSFASKKDAKEFAKFQKQKNIPLKPYILKTIVPSSAFKKGAVVEKASKKDIEKDKFNAFCELIK